MAEQTRERSGGASLSPEDRRAAREAVARADKCRDSRDWEGARKAYAEALDLDPKMQPIWVQLGHAAKESGDHLAADEAYRKAIELRPEDPDAHLQLGHLLKIRGLMAPAMQAYGEALRLNPMLMDARSEIEGLERQTNINVKPIGQSFGDVSFGPYVTARQTIADGTFTIVFDVSDLMHYFHNARLPTGIQRVQIEVIKNVIESRAADLNFALVCFTKQSDFWVEIPPSLFQLFCKLSVSSGDVKAPEWHALLADLSRLLQSKRYYRFPRGSMLLNLGTSWWLQNYFLNVRLAKSLYDVNYIPFVHDFIPAITPEHCVDALRQDFLSWAVGAFDHADYFLVNSQATLRDLRAVGSQLGHPVPEAAVVTLDADFRRSLEQSELLDADYLLYTKDLAKGRYVLFVATIESRKNHIAAFSVWLKLLKKYGPNKVPKLVCVGNDGWLNDAAYSKLRASELLSHHVVMLSKISDAALAVLYENCLCTLYPSSYEGWGLPVTEALCFGKLPIVSNSSSLPEAGGDFAEYFDVDSEKDFMSAVERVIFREEYREDRERDIKTRFRPRTWGDISNQIVGQLRTWHAAKKPKPTLNVQTPVAGIWPVAAQLNEVHRLGSNTSSTLWPGLQSGEIFRNGANWWWPEPWGTWIKSLGPAYVAFQLEGARHEPLLMYISLRGIQGKSSTATVRAHGSPPLEVTLATNEQKVVKLKLPPDAAERRLVVVSIACSAAVDFAAQTGGTDPRMAGIGVCWFYVCKENDVLGRLNLLEAIAVDDVERLQREAPVEQDVLLAAQ